MKLVLFSCFQCVCVLLHGGQRWFLGRPGGRAKKFSRLAIDRQSTI